MWNPYLRKAKKQLTIRLDEDTIAFLKALAQKNRDSVPKPDQSLSARECAEYGETLAMKWS